MQNKDDQEYLKKGERAELGTLKCHLLWPWNVDNNSR